MEINISVAKADVAAAKKLHPASHIRQVGLDHAITILERVEKLGKFLEHYSQYPDTVGQFAGKIYRMLSVGEEW